MYYWVMEQIPTFLELNIIYQVVIAIVTSCVMTSSAIWLDRVLVKRYTVTVSYQNTHITLCLRCRPYNVAKNIDQCMSMAIPTIKKQNPGVTINPTDVSVKIVRL